MPHRIIASPTASGREPAGAAPPTRQLALPWRGEAKAADAAARRLRA